MTAVKKEVEVVIEVDTRFGMIRCIRYIESNKHLSRTYYEVSVNGAVTALHMGRW